ncbi:MAG: hypothetical protein GC165_08080 [Armatimonadetes bacterium]|nr:hypothetical protein [Armatimonadota bacterium]
MPTRYTLKGSGKPIFEEMEKSFLGDEIAPTTFVPAICQHGEMKLLRWGLTPSWAKEDFGGSMLHARRERLFDQSAFKTSIWRRRCLLPATAFFEWRDEVDSVGVDPLDPQYLGVSTRAKYRFTVPSMPLFYFAGIWDDWIDPNGSEIASCAIVTTYPNPLILRYKPWMPSIMQTADLERWLDHTIENAAEIDVMLRGLDADRFHVERV